jgi:hypothetical protein
MVRRYQEEGPSRILEMPHANVLITATTATARYLLSADQPKQVHHMAMQKQQVVHSGAVPSLMLSCAKSNVVKRCRFGLVEQLRIKIQNIISTLEIDKWACETCRTSRVGS